MYFIVRVLFVILFLVLAYYIYCSMVTVFDCVD